MYSAGDACIPGCSQYGVRVHDEDYEERLH